MSDAVPSGSPAGAAGSRVWPALLLAALACALLFLLAGRSSLWDRDEPRFARAGLEMAASGNWLYPTFNGELRPDKPIFIYWMMQPALALLGSQERAVRLPAVLGAGTALLLTWLLGRRRLGAGALIALAVLGSTALFLLTGSAATTDALLLAWITAALLAIWRALAAGPSWGSFSLLGFALAGALFTKGPVGLGIPLLVAVPAWLLARSARPRAGPFFLFLLGGSAVAIVLFLAWGLPANWATDGEFLRLGLGRHVVHRSLQPMESHGGDFFLYLPYYFLTPLATFFPWTLFLPGALSALLGARTFQGPLRALLLAWIAAPLVLMTLVSTKLPHYILPIWPALALSVGALLPAYRRGELAPRDLRLLRAGVWLFMPVAAAFSVLVGGVPWYLPLSAKARILFPVLALILLVLAVLAARKHRALRVSASAGLLGCWVLVTLFSAAFVILPALEAVRPVRPLAAALEARLLADLPVHEYAYREPSLLFYLGTRPVLRLSREQARAWPDQPGPGLLVTRRTAWEALHPGALPAGVREVASQTGYDFSRGRPLELIALGKGLGP